MSLFDLLKDRRERIVRPHKLAPLLADLMFALQQIFEACYATTRDSHWLDGSDRVFRARRELLAWAEHGRVRELERSKEGAVFAGKIVGDASRFRKPQALVRDVRSYWARRAQLLNLPRKTAPKKVR